MNRQSQGKRVARAMSRLWSASVRASLFRLLALLGFAFAAWLLAGTATAHADSSFSLPEAETNVLSSTLEAVEPVTSPAQEVVDQSAPIVGVVEQAAPYVVGAGSRSTPALGTEFRAVESVDNVLLSAQELLDTPGQAPVSPLDSTLRPARVAAVAVTNTADVSNTGIVSRPEEAIPAQQPIDPSRTDKDAVAGLPAGSKASEAVVMQPTFAAFPLATAEDFSPLPVVPQPAELPILGSTGQVGGGSVANPGSVAKGASGVVREYVPQLNRAETVDSLADTAVSQEFTADRSFSPD